MTNGPYRSAAYHPHCHPDRQESLMAPQNVRGDSHSVDFTISQDPSFLRVNMRFRNSHYLPAPVRAAREDVIAASRAACSEVNWDAGDAYVGVGFTFAVDSRKEDADGPLKRVLDAVADGCHMNDSRVKRIEVEREIVPEGQEHIDVRLYRIPAAPGERIPETWKGHDPQFVWEDDGGAD